ncbi:MAG: SGNH/GDSL hydrolase family protein [Armatimonadetes bacterium]|nr:SGNH/GDSL hydrolase family protein [Armatimonadota bacterium]
MFILVSLAGAALAADSPPDPSLAPVEDVAGLPRVLLLGDSISMGYTLPARELLAGKANVHRAPENCGPTSRGVQQIDAWLADGPWDVIHFNFGLHDLKREADGRQQVPLEQYEANLKTLVGKLQATGAKLIWASTTPVPEGPVAPVRVPADVIAYNAVAAGIMAESGILVDDLYAFALPRLSELQTPVNVHFTPAGSRALAQQVARAIESALAG